MSIEFVRATENDAPFICSLFSNEEYERIFAENNTSVDEWKSRFAYFEDRHNLIVVDKCCNQKIGWLMYEIQRTQCFLHLLIVRYEYIGITYSLQILEEMEKAILNQVESIELDVQQSNIRAVNFYERNGFRIIGLEKWQVGNGEEMYYKMKKNLIKQ